MNEERSTLLTWAKDTMIKSVKNLRPLKLSLWNYKCHQMNENNRIIKTPSSFQLSISLEKTMKKNIFEPYE
jgi:hypothetical protein